jgi:hypothetical protein
MERKRKEKKKTEEAHHSKTETINLRVFGFPQNYSALHFPCLSFWLCAPVKVVGVWCVCG